jgi:hypothetical protein
MDCATLCRTVAEMLMRDSEHTSALSPLCARVCDACAESCEQVGDDRVMKRCAEVCRKCAAMCRAI